MSEQALEEALERIATVTAEEFESQIGQPFRFVLTPDLTLQGRILRVRRLATQTPKSRRLPFAVEMAVEGRKYFHQATVRFENDALGAMDIFAVPTGPADGGMGYELIFT